MKLQLTIRSRRIEMKSVYRLLMSGVLLVLMPTAQAELAVEPPPVHKQKQDIPDSTKNGNYLEPQDQDTSGTESSREGATSGNAKEKSKRFEKDPEHGGTEVKQKRK